VKKIERCLFMCIQLQKKKEISVKDLALKFNTSKRTIQRDILIISNILPLYSVGKAYKII
jgi:DeoR/GlpR family transcriptional regulator of sugar metabolism